MKMKRCLTAGTAAIYQGSLGGAANESVLRTNLLSLATNANPSSRKQSRRRTP